MAPGTRRQQGASALTCPFAPHLQAGISAGDTVIYTSSFFGDELWVSDQVLAKLFAISSMSEELVALRRGTMHPTGPRIARTMQAPAWGNRVAAVATAAAGTGPPPSNPLPRLGPCPPLPFAPLLQLGFTRSALQVRRQHHKQPES